MRRWWCGSTRITETGLAARNRRAGFPAPVASVPGDEARLRGTWPAPDGRRRPAPARRGRAACSSKARVLRGEPGPDKGLTPVQSPRRVLSATCARGPSFLPRDPLSTVERSCGSRTCGRRESFRRAGAATACRGVRGRWTASGCGSGVDEGHRSRAAGTGWLVRARAGLQRGRAGSRRDCSRTGRRRRPGASC